MLRLCQSVWERTSGTPVRKRTCTAWHAKVQEWQQTQLPLVGRGLGDGRARGGAGDDGGGEGSGGGGSSGSDAARDRFATSEAAQGASGVDPPRPAAPHVGGDADQAGWPRQAATQQMDSPTLRAQRQLARLLRDKQAAGAAWQHPARRPAQIERDSCGGELDPGDSRVHDLLGRPTAAGAPARARCGDARRVGGGAARRRARA